MTDVWLHYYFYTESHTNIISCNIPIIRLFFTHIFILHIVTKITNDIVSWNVFTIIATLKLKLKCIKYNNEFGDN